MRTLSDKEIVRLYLLKQGIRVAEKEALTHVVGFSVGFIGGIWAKTVCKTTIGKIISIPIIVLAGVKAEFLTRDIIEKHPDASGLESLVDMYAYLKCVLGKPKESDKEESKIIKFNGKK